jgi:Fungal protein kinase
MFTVLLCSVTPMQDFSLSSSSPFEMVDTPVPSLPGMTPGCENLHPANFVLRTQSSGSRFHGDDKATAANVSEIDVLLRRDIQDRTMEVGDGIVADLFPDETFGFPINDQFVKNFCGSIIDQGKLITTINFKTETTAATFLNQMITTIAEFLDSTKKTSLKPLRYFSAVHANTPVDGTVKVKPDLMIVPLIDNCIRQGRLSWKDAHSIVELSQEKKVPLRMIETVRVKTYMAFCEQPERDFFPFFCITKDGFLIILTDHSGQISTDLIPFSRNASTLIFFRLVMGLAFLPSSYLGLDPTIIRRDQGEKGDKKLSDAFPSLGYKSTNPNIRLFAPDSSTTITPPTTCEPDFDDDSKGDKGIVSISIKGKTYEVVRLLFQSKTLVGRATKVFLVKLPNGSLGVVKDSWIPSERASEASFLERLDIPFGPQLVDHCVLGDTRAFRDNPFNICVKKGYREKRRILTYPAGVHISDFSCLWELMAALLDTVVCMINPIYLFDHSSDFDMAFSYIVPRILPKDAP